MPGEKRTIKCPFCKEGNIETLYFEREQVSRVARAAGNSKTITYMKDPRTEVISEKCPNCGKSKREIEKRLKQGKSVSKEDVIARMKAAGLDPSRF